MTDEEIQLGCPIRDVLQQVMDTWSVGILLLLRHGTLRFSEIYRQLPGNISKRMLSKTLRSLEEHGLIDRRVYPTKPPRVEYELNDLGRSFLPILQNLEQWAIQHQEQVLAAREAFQQKDDSQFWEAK